MGAFDYYVKHFDGIEVQPNDTTTFPILSIVTNDICLEHVHNWTDQSSLEFHLFTRADATAYGMYDKFQTVLSTGIVEVADSFTRPQGRIITCHTSYDSSVYDPQDGLWGHYINNCDATATLGCEIIWRDMIGMSTAC